MREEDIKQCRARDPQVGQKQCLISITRHFPGLGILSQMPNSAFTAWIRLKDIIEVVPRRRECQAALAHSVGIPPLERYVLVSERLAGADARGDVSSRTTLGGSAMTAILSLAPLLERFAARQSGWKSHCLA